MLMEVLQSIPDASVGVKLDGYHAEILQVKDNVFSTVKVWEVTPQETLPFTD